MTPGHADAHPSSDLFSEQLDTMLNPRHDLYRLADLVDGSVFDKALGARYCPCERHALFQQSAARL